MCIQYLSAIVGTVFGEDAVDLWVLDGAEHQSLAIVLGPVVQAPHPHPGEVHTMRVQRLQVHVVHHVLQRRIVQKHSGQFVKGCIMKISQTLKSQTVTRSVKAPVEFS